MLHVGIKPMSGTHWAELEKLVATPGCGVLGVLDMCRDRCQIKTSKKSKQGRHTRVNSTQRGQWGLKPEAVLRISGYTERTST